MQQELRAACDKHPKLKPALVSSISDPVEMLEERFSQLSLKGIPFRSLKSPTGPQWTRLNELLEQISPGLSKIKSWDNKKISKNHPEVFALIENTAPRTDDTT